MILNFFATETFFAKKQLKMKKTEKLSAGICYFVAFVMDHLAWVVHKCYIVGKAKIFKIAVSTPKLFDSFDWSFGGTFWAKKRGPHRLRLWWA